MAEDSCKQVFATKHRQAKAYSGLWLDALFHKACTRCRHPLEATDESVELVYVDQCYTGEVAETAEAEHGIQLHMVKNTEAKRGFVLLPRRWVVEGAGTSDSATENTLRASTSKLSQ